MLMEFHLRAAADSVQQEKGRVLVHCMTGTSMYISSFYTHHTCMSAWIIADMIYAECRSPSVVIGYLMRLRRWRLNESYKWVHDRRACVSLQEGNHPGPEHIPNHCYHEHGVEVTCRPSKACRP